MASASVSTTSNHQGRMATLTVEETSYSIENNTSTVTWTLEVKGGSSNYYNAYEVAAYVNGSTVYGPTSKTWDTQTFPAARGTRTGTITITHNADGSASAMPFSIRGAFFNNNPTTVNGTALTLTTIPRATTPSCAGGTLGNNITITTTPASNSFTHTIKIWNGSTLKQTISNVGSSTTWNPSLATYGSEIVSSKVYTLECITYNGSTQIGTKSISVTLSFPSTGYAPTCTVSVSPENSAFPSGWPSAMYVQYKSRVNVTVGFTGQYGATLSSRTSTVEGVSNSNANWTSNLLSSSGSHTVSATVKDNRNRTGSATSSAFTVIPYYSPRINTSTVSRTDTQLSVVYAFDIAPVNYSSSNRNAHTFKVEYKKTSASSWTTLVNNTSDYSKSNTTATATIEAASSYDIRFTVTDSCGSVSTTTQVGTAFDLMNFNSSGLAMAIGKISEASSSEQLFEVGMPAILNRIVSPGGRVTSLDFAHTYPHSRVSMQLNCASSSVSSNSPGDGYVQTFFWDNSGAWDTQLYLPDSSSVRPKLRHRGGGSWPSTWREIAMTSDLPSVGNGTITMQINGSSKGTFTTNQSGNTTINMGTGYLTSHQTNVTKGGSAVTSGYYLRFPTIKMQICWCQLAHDQISIKANQVTNVVKEFTFPVAFSEVPMVCTFMNSGSSAATVGYIQHSAFNITTTKFEWRGFSKDSSARTPSIGYLAIGPYS